MRCPILTACRNGSLGSGCNGGNGGKWVANESLQTEEDAFKTWERSLIEACHVNVRARNERGDLTQNICVNAARDTHSDDLRYLTVSRIVIAQLNKVTLHITQLLEIRITCIKNSMVPLIILQYESIAFCLIDVDSWLTISHNNGDVRYIQPLAKLCAEACSVS